MGPWGLNQSKKFFFLFLPSLLADGSPRSFEARNLFQQESPYLWRLALTFRGRGHDINICLNRNLKIMVEHFFFSYFNLKSAARSLTFHVLVAHRLVVQVQVDVAAALERPWSDNR